MSFQTLPITRRSLIRGLASASSLAPLASLGHAQDDKPKEKIGYCIVGLGRISLQHFMPGCLQSKKSKVVALVSGHRDKALEAAKSYNVAATSIYSYDNYDQIADNKEIDAVYIALPNNMHAEYTIRAAKAGKHVLCEKPMSTTVNDAQAMINACKAAGKRLMIAYRCQYEPTNLRAIELIKSGRLGVIQSIESAYGFNERAGEWRLNKKMAGGGPMMDVGIYALNACRYLTDEEPRYIEGFCSVNDHDGRFDQVEENVSWLMRFPSGILASCNTTYGAQMNGFFRVHGSKGVLHVEPAFSYDGLQLKAQINGEPEISELNNEKDPVQFAREADHFSNCILNGEEPKSNGDEGLRDMHYIAEIYKSCGRQAFSSIIYLWPPLDMPVVSEIDPVCGMKVDPGKSGPSSSFHGHTYYFCGAGCKKKFDAAPESFLAPKPVQKPSDKNIEYTCPMDPQIRQMGPGTCPICGMALEPVQATAGEESNAELTSMTRRFWICATLTVPLLALMLWPKLPWLECSLATPVVLWGGLPFFQRGWASIKNRRWNMFTLIALGTGASYLFSLFTLLFPQFIPASFRDMHGRLPLYFEPAAVITTLVLLGQVLELRARSQTSSALKSLLNLAPKTARLVESDNERDIPLDQVRAGHILRVRPGEKVPVDGVVLEGSSSIDESMVTGESMPVAKSKDARVTGGTLNSSGGLLMRADRVGGDMLLNQIVRLVGEAQRTRAPIQRLADKAAGFFVPAVVIASIVTFALWALWGPDPKLAHAFVNAIAVLIIACPCALGLATPMSIMVGTGRGATAGILIRNAEALEILHKIDLVAVDKTGTLTEGKPTLVALHARAPFSEEQVLMNCAALERSSEHPLSAAIVQAAQQRSLMLPDARNFQSITGKGIKGTVSGSEVLVGASRFLRDAGIDTTQMEEDSKSALDQAQTIIFIAIDGQPAGWLAIADPIRETTREALQMLHHQRVRVAMLTGDSPDTAAAIAAQLHLDDFEAGMLPEQKAAAVKKWQAEGHTVAMAGDGVNDAPALAAANVGIAMGTGTDIAMESAGITLVKGDLRGIVRALLLSRATVRNIRQNLLFAFLYNVLGIPIAAGLLYPFFGILLSPMLASAAMTLSSVSVITNALRLRTVEL